VPSSEFGVPTFRATPNPNLEVRTPSDENPEPNLNTN